MRCIVVRLLTLALASSVACSESSRPTQPTPGPVAPRLVTFAGVISESETNTPLAGVAVCFPLRNCAPTGADGLYRFTIDPATLTFAIGSNTSLCPFAFLDGYEQRRSDASSLNSRFARDATGNLSTLAAAIHGRPEA